LGCTHGFDPFRIEEAHWRKATSRI
jgi:hypothetical protein